MSRMSEREICELLTCREGWILDDAGDVYSRRFRFDDRETALDFLRGAAAQLPGDDYRFTLVGCDVIVANDD